MTTCLASAKNNQRSIEMPIVAVATATIVNINEMAGIKKVRLIRITGKTNKLINTIFRNFSVCFRAI